MKVVGLFAGIGGLELGLARAGHSTVLMSEIDSGACEVLRERFPGKPVVGDIRDLLELPSGTDLIAAGFPCQDLSQAGSTEGISGERSGLVNEVFRLARVSRPDHLLIENVPFMLSLHGGAAIRHITASLESLGYAWAYRLLDSRAFGLPQRRRRVFLLASRVDQPWERLFAADIGELERSDYRGVACGFYWTEGVRGLGWAVDAIPTLKGGSTIGIPSPPAIWMPDGQIVTPDIRDAERLQGFPANWTQPAERATRPGHRWKLVGNAVTVHAATWLGRRLAKAGEPIQALHAPFRTTGRWPEAAFGAPGRPACAVEVSAWPMRPREVHLVDFLRHPPKPLSHRAVSGFVGRLKSGRLRYPLDFLKALEAHAERSCNDRVQAAA